MSAFAQGIGAGAAAGANAIKAAVEEQKRRTEMAIAAMQAQTAMATAAMAAGTQRSGQAAAERSQAADREQRAPIIAAQAKEMQLNNTAKERQLELQKGTTDAFQQGGLPAVIDYLKGTDPDQASKLQAQQQQLEAGVLANEKLKNATDMERQQVLNQSYGTLGAAGEMIRQMPAEQREAAYKEAYPMLSQLVPNLPSSFRDAAPLMRIGLGMATGPAQLYKAQGAQLKMQSEAGKAAADLVNARMAGADPEMIKTLESKTAELQAKAQESQLNVTNKKLSMQGTKAGMENVLRDDYTKASDEYTNAKNSYQKLYSIYNDITSGNYKGSPGALDNALIVNTARMFEKGVLTDADMARYANTDPRINTLYKQYFTKVAEGATLTPQERENLVTMGESILQSQYVPQKERQAKYVNLAVSKDLDPNALKVLGVQSPQEIRDSIKAAAADKEGMFAGVPDQFKASVEKALAAGVPKDKIQGLLGKLTQGTQQGQPQEQGGAMGQAVDQQVQAPQQGGGMAQAMMPSGVGGR